MRKRVRPIRSPVRAHQHIQLPVARMRRCSTTGCGRRGMPPIGQGSKASMALPSDLARLMFARPHAFALYHRERFAVLLSSALFLAGAIPLLWAVG